MKYLKNSPFITAIGEPFQISFAQEEPMHDATVPEMVRLCLGAYQPNPQGQKVLDIGALRLLNRCIDILEGEPDDFSYFSFEDATWKLLVQVVGWTSIFVQPRNAPLIEDALNAVEENRSKSNSKLALVNGEGAEGALEGAEPVMPVVVQ
jgi:hypothetical protein